MTTHTQVSDERLAEMLVEFKTCFVDQAGCTLDSDQSEEVYRALTDLSARRATVDVTEALQAAREMADVMEGMTGCRSDDEWVWAVQAKINAALAALAQQAPE